MPQQYSYTAPTANAGLGVNPMDAKEGVNSSVIIQPDESAFTVNNMPVNPYAPTNESDTSNFMSDNSTSEPNESESNTPDISASIENHLNEATIADSAPNPEPVNLDQNPSDFGDDDWGDNSADTATKTFKIKPVDPTYTAPKGLTLGYTGSEQTLATAGTAKGGTMYYSLDGKNWSTEVPKGKDVKKYTIYYKIDGDSNHNDLGPFTVGSEITRAKAKITKDAGSVTVPYDGKAHNMATAGSGSGFLR